MKRIIIAALLTMSSTGFAEEAKVEKAVVSAHSMQLQIADAITLSSKLWSQITESSYFKGSKHMKSSVDANDLILKTAEFLTNARDSSKKSSEAVEEEARQIALSIGKDETAKKNLVDYLNNHHQLVTLLKEQRNDPIPCDTCNKQLNPYGAPAHAMQTDPMYKQYQYQQYSIPYYYYTQRPTER